MESEKKRGEINYYYYEDTKLDSMVCGNIPFLYVEYLNGQKVDVETAWRNAIHEHLHTEEGREAASQYGSYNWGDAFGDVPEEILEKHGIFECKHEPHVTAWFTVNHDENFKEDDDGV
jgi:hypothetical protein